MSRDRRVAVIGLAGGIGAGKSTVARALERHGCVVVDSDALAKEALDRASVRAQLVDWWGTAILDGKGMVDRGAVAKIVFQDGAQRRRLEGIVHPLVKSARSAIIEEANRRGAPAVVIDAPLLFEAGSDSECDAVIFVDAPMRDRLERVRASRGWDRLELARREAAQMPLEEKRRRSKYVLNNRGDPAEIDHRVGEILVEILRARR